MQPRIDSITYTMRRGSPPRKLLAGDEKFVKGKLMVRQQQKYAGMMAVSNGRPVWQWVEWGSERDRCRNQARYRTLRHGIAVPAPPEGWKILESGRPIPKKALVYNQGYGADGVVGWFLTKELAGREAKVDGEHRAFAIPKTNDEMTRDYFESGCTCIGTLFKKRGPEIGAERATKFYLTRCKCSRHPEYQHAAD